jgi:hypothetical protein
MYFLLLFVCLSYGCTFLPLALNDQTDLSNASNIQQSFLLGRTGFQGKVKAVQTKPHGSREF